MTSLTPPISTVTPSQSPSTSQTTSDPVIRKAGIIAGAVIGGLLIVCIIVAIIVPLQRRRGKNKIQRQVYRAKSEVEVSASAADGTSPLLVTPHAWHSRPNDAEDDTGAAEAGIGPGAEASDRSRGTSDSTLLMPLVHESSPDAASAYPTNSPKTKDRSPSLSPNLSPIRRLAKSDSVTSHESTYSQASASTRMHRDVAERFTSSPSPVPRLPTQLQLPQIPQTAPIGELLKSRAAAAGPVPYSRNENGSLDSTSFSPTSIYSQASPTTSANIHRQLSRGPSAGTRTSDQPLQSTLRPSRGAPSRSRTVLPNAPMEPLMELDGSGAWSLPPSGNGTERWSSAADPGGSRARPVSLDNNPKNDAETKNDPPALTPSQPQGLGFGLGLLTTAFRKSLSASSVATQGSSASSSSQNGNMNTLHHYPSVASMGASVTSGTGSGTGSFYTAMSDVGNESQSVGNRNSGAGMFSSGKMKKKKKESRTSLSTYPSIPSLSSTSSPSPPPVPPVPPLPLPLLSKPTPSLPTQDKASTLNADLNPKPSPTPRAKAHLRTPSAHRVRADPHPQLPITRPGRSTHGIIDLLGQ